MDSTFIRWRRLDRPGHDVARLTEMETGSILEGTAVFVEDDQPCRLDYRIVGLTGPACVITGYRASGGRADGWITGRSEKSLAYRSELSSATRALPDRPAPA